MYFFKEQWFLFLGGNEVMFKVRLMFVIGIQILVNEGRGIAEGVSQ